MRLMIIDDDMQIREGITEGIDWSEEGIGEVRSYGNAITALHELDSFCPDIILSDVRMPGMDGLEFLKKVREDHPQVKVIMISAHSDFEYVKKALEHGAQDYELKPLKFRKLIAIIRKTVKLIREERSQSEKQDEYFRQYRKVLLRKVLLGDEHLNRQARSLFSQHVRISDEYTHLCMTLKIITDDSPVLPIIEERILPCFSKSMKFHLYLEAEKQLVMILKLGDRFTSIVRNQLRTDVSNLQEMLGAGTVRVSGGVSEVYSLEDIPKAYALTCSLLEHTAYLGAGTLCFRQDLGKGIEKDLGRLEGLQEEVSSAFIDYDKDRMAGGIRSISEWFISHQESQHSRYRKVIIDNEVMIMHRKGDSSLFDIGRTTKAINGLFYLDDIIGYWNRLFCSTMDDLVKKEHSNLSSMTVSALDYIHKHYKEHISAGDVASYINKSPNYFSSVFKKDLSISFKEYVNTLRIKEAERLIREGNEYIYEVADQVGFSDYTYFYQVFKRVTGYEPTKLKKN